MRFSAVLRFAARDLRGGLGGLRVFIACIALGVAAIVGVNSLSRSLGEGLTREGRVILGGDASFSLIHRELSDAERAFLGARGTLSTVATMRGMARAGDGEAALVEVKAVEPGWPQLGQATLAPAMDVEAALAPKDGVYGVAAEAALLDRLGLRIGDALKLGEATLAIRAVLVAEPDRLGGGIGLGPRLLLARQALDATGLVQPGSLVRWTTRVLMPGPPAQADVLVLLDAAKANFPEAGWETRERSAISPDFTRSLERFTEFLSLVGLASLIVGGVGVANAAQGFVERKRETLAILKTIGASGGEVFALAMAEFLAVALIGVAIGLGIGAAAPFAVDRLFGDLLPFPLAPAIFAREIALGAFYGLMTALAFSTPSLGRAHDLKVTELFRSLIERRGSWPRWRYVALTGVAAALLAGAAIAASPQKSVAVWAVAALVLAMALLRAVAWAVMALARRAPPRGPVEWRMAVASLHRPGALTPSILSSLGLGLGVLVALTLVDVSLRGQLRQTQPGKTPSFYFLDVRSPELPGFRAFLAQKAPDAGIVEVPMMRGRFMKIGDVPVERVHAKESAAWALEGDRGITFAETEPEGSELVAGAWWPRGYDGPPLVSLESEVADGLGLKLGDSVTVNVLGRNVAAQVANLRKVNWRSFAINFVMVFSPNAFTGAPHTVLVSAAFPAGVGAGRELALAHDLAKAYPAVVSVRVSEALAQVEQLVGKLATAIRAASGVALLTSVLVLAGALSANRRARLGDAVILKILGATRRRLVAAFLIEYALLGSVAALFGLLAGAAAAAGIVIFVMKLDFAFAAGPAFAAAFGALTLTVALGMAGAWRILGQKPAAFLREL